MSDGAESSPLLEKEKPGKGKCLQFLSGLTVEPALVLFSLGNIIDSIYLPQLQMDRICSLVYNFSDEICDNLSSGQHEAENDAVQRVASRYNAYGHWVEFGPALLTLIPLGAWSDIRDRKTPVVLTFVGSLLTSLVILASANWRLLSASFTFLCFIPVGITGSYLGLYATTSMYLSDVSDTRSRTFRLAIIEILKYGLSPLGIYIAFVIFRQAGYVGVYLFQASLFAASTLYLAVRLEKRRPEGVGESESRPRSVWEVVKPSSIKRSFALLWKERQEGYRTQILICLVIICLYIFQVVKLILTGGKSMFYLYTQDRFSWKEEQFSIWTAVDFSFHAVGTLVVLPIISYYMKVSDSLVIFLGGVSLMFYSVIVGTAPVSWALYLASLTSVFVLMIQSGGKAKISKLVERDEVGAVFSVLSIPMAIIPIFATTIYSIVYSATLDVFPGALFVGIAGTCVITCCLSVWMYTRYDLSNLKDELQSI